MTYNELDFLKNMLTFQLFKTVNKILDLLGIPLYGNYSSEKIISQKYRFICITIPLSASRSLSHLFKKYFSNDIYITKKSLSRILREKPEYESYFKFTIIRDPWSKTVSYYNKKILNANNYKKIYILSKYKKMSPKFTFNQLVKWLCTDNGSDYEADKHWISPHKLLIDDYGKININYIGKIESINKDLKIVFEKLDLNFDESWLQIYKSSKTMQKKPIHMNYKDYYSEETTKLIAMRYKEYIEWSGYCFENDKKAQHN